jgi:RES domain-containing protein
MQWVPKSLIFSLEHHEFWSIDETGTHVFVVPSFVSELQNCLKIIRSIKKKPSTTKYLKHSETIKTKKSASF